MKLPTAVRVCAHGSDALLLCVLVFFVVWVVGVTVLT